MKIWAAYTYFEKFFNIRTNERKFVHLLFLYVVVISAFYNVSITASETLFLKKVSAQSVQSLLSWVYLSIGVSILTISLFFSKLIKRFSRTLLLVSAKIFFASSLLVFWLLLKLYPTNEWLYFYLNVWINSTWIICLSLFYWYLGDFFNVRDARRLYGYITAGLAFGGCVGGIIVVAFTKFFPIVNLLLAGVGLLLLCPVIISILSTIPAHRLLQHTDENDEYFSITFKKIFSNKYICLIFLIFFIEGVCFAFSDYQLLIMANSSFNETQLSYFFGTLYSSIGGVQLFIQFILSGYLLRRFGVIRNLLILPILLVISCWGFILSPILFWSTLINSIYIALGETQNKTSKEMLFLLLPNRLRIYSQFLSSGVLMALGNIIGGCGLILFSFYFMPIEYYILFLMLLSAVWLVGVLLLYPQYTKTLATSIWHRFSDASSLKMILSARESLQYIKKILRSNEKNKILLILNSLPEHSFQNIRPELEKLVRSDDEDVVAKTLYLMAQHHLVEGAFMLDFLNDPRQKVLETTIVGYCKLCGEKALERIEPYLKSHHPLIRLAAVEGCYHYCGKQGKKKSRRVFFELLKNEPLLCIKIIRKSDVIDFRSSLNKFLLNKHIEARKIAINICMIMPDVSFFDNLVVNFLTYKSLRPLVINALSALPQEAVRAIQKVILDQQAPEDLRCALLRVLGNIGGPQAEEVIIEILMGDTPLPVMISAVLSLRNLFSSHKSLMSAPLDKCRAHIFNKALILKETYQEIETVDPLKRRFFLESFYFYLGIIFNLISIQSGLKEVRRIIQFVVTKNNKQLLNGLELLESILPREQFLALIALLTISLDAAADGTKEPMIRHRDALLNLDSWVRSLTLTLHTNSKKHPLTKENNMKKIEKDIIELVDLVTFLKTSELFSDLPPHYLSIFKEIFQEVSLNAGESLFQEGDEDHSLYLIRKGRVSLQQKNKEILQVGEGGCIGTLSVLLDSPRTATAVVLEDADLLKLTSQDLDDILITYPEVSLNLLKILAKRLRNMNRMYIQQNFL